MNSINHALWGATIGRAVGLPLEGALIASVPDIVTIPLFAWSKYRYSPKLTQAPRWVFKTYYFVHNWFTAVGASIALSFISPVLGILGLGYLWHTVEDAFLHTDLASPFLWPVWKGKIKAYSAADHPWIQILDLSLIIAVNYLLFPKPPVMSPILVAVIVVAVLAGIMVGKS